MTNATSFKEQMAAFIFAIPYENEFTLIGTTDIEHKNLDAPPECSVEEVRYLVDFANQYFKKPITTKDVVWTYSGIRPLYDDGAASASATTRDYVMTVDKAGGAPILNIFGGKITTYRCLAEDALDKIAEQLRLQPESGQLACLCLAAISRSMA